MKSIFQFNSRDSFRSSDSTEFAKLLLRAHGNTRKRIRQTFGLSIELDADPVRVKHDGQRIGIGAFEVNGSEVHFIIGPKVAIDVHELIKSLQGTEYWAKLVSITPGINKTEVIHDKADLTPAFLTSLHRQIADYAARHVDITHLRRQKFVGWKLQGRPLVGDSIRRFARGKLDGLVCDVYDDKAFADYADVLVGTASSIRDVLNSWGDIIQPIQTNLEVSTRLIFGRLGHLTGTGFSMPKLLRICRPPFPMGLRELLYSCMRYWRWHGEFRMASNPNIIAGFWQLALRLDQLFEQYVGIKWNQALQNKYSWKNSPNFDYEVKTVTGNYVSRNAIIPDHLFTCNDEKTLLVVDAKYRTDIGARDQVNQMSAYLNYKYPANFYCPQAIGILVYPGVDWRVCRIGSFSPSIFTVEMPINSSDISEGICATLKQIKTQ